MTPHPIAPTWGAYSSHDAPIGPSGVRKITGPVGSGFPWVGGNKASAGMCLLSGQRHRAITNSASAELRAAPALVGVSSLDSAAGAGHFVSASVAGFLADASSHLTTFRVAAANDCHVASCSSDITTNPTQ